MEKNNVANKHLDDANDKMNPNKTFSNYFGTSRLRLVLNIFFF